MTLILSSAPSQKEAMELSRLMIGEHLAACVNIVPKALSIYEWRGEVKEEQECLLLIKTSKKNEKSLIDFIQKHHSYEVPEIVLLEANAEAAYKDWLYGQCADENCAD